MSQGKRRAYGTYLIAFALALVAALWVASGALFGDSAPEVRKEAAALDELEASPKVRVRQQRAESRTHTLAVQGRTQADRKVTLRAETHGRVEAVLVDKGDRVEQGQVVARLAVEDRPAALKQAEARLEQRRVELEAARRLSEKGYRARTALAAAEAEYKAAHAAVRAAEVELANTEIRAPFAATVGARMVEVGDYVSTGDEVVRLVDLDPIKVLGQVSERNVGRLALDGPATAETVTGETIEGRITYIAPEADGETRTFAVEMAAENVDGRIRDGVTAELRFPLRRESAHFLAPSILTLSDDGRIGVKTVGPEDRVRFHPVKILADTPEGVWVAGLPEQVTLITVGQNFVTTGQQVTPVTETAVAESLADTPLELPPAGPPGPDPATRR